MTAATRFRSLLKQVLSFGVAFGIWFSPIPAGLTKEAWHLFADICGGDLLRHSERISTPDGLAAGGIGCGAYSHGRSRQGLCWFRQRERAPRCRRLSRRQRGGEIGTRTAHQPSCCECIRAIHARVGLQHFSHRCHDRTRISEQYGARWRALPHHSFPGPRVPAPSRTTRRTAGWVATSCSAGWPASASRQPSGSPPPPAIQSRSRWQSTMV